MARAVTLPRDQIEYVARARRRRLLTAIGAYAVLLGLGLLFCFPFIWTLGTSLKTAQETHIFPPTIWPETPQWGNYVRVWGEQPMLQWLGNSLLIIVLSVPGAVVSGALVAYSFARFDFPGRNALFMVVLATLMIPLEVRLIPQYLLFQRFGWVDTYYPLIVPSWLGGGAVTIFLLRQFFMTIPRDLDAAATIDGANSWQILWRIILPLAKPALATVAILQFLAEWNDFLGPLIYLNKPAMFTMSLGLRFFQTAPESSGETKEHLLMAATVITTLPAILLFFTAQRHFIRGIVMTGLKG
jgi:multiple sugar transport system permease protein